MPNHPVSSIMGDNYIKTTAEHPQSAIRAFFFLSLSKVAAGWHMLSVLYLAPRPETFGGRFWCTENPKPTLGLAQMSEDRLNNKIFTVNVGDACMTYYFPNSSHIEKNLTLDAYMIECHKFEFEMERPTMVSEWSLVCNRDFLVNVVQLSYLIGIFAGGFATTVLLKRFSTRAVFSSAVVLQVVAGVGSALVPTYEMHLVFKMLTALGVCVTFSTAYNACIKFSEGWLSVTLGVCFEMWWSVGVISLGWLHQLAPSWRALQLIISLPSALLLIPCWFIFESPKSEARNKGYARLCANKGKPMEEHLTWWKYCCLQLLWMITIFNYYGALLNVRNVSMGLLLATRTSLAGCAEVIGAIFGIALLILRPNKKFSYLSFLLTAGGLACIATWPSLSSEIGGNWTFLALVLTGRVGIACSMAVLQNGVYLDPEVSLLLISGGRLVLQAAPFSNSAFVAWGQMPGSTFYGALCLVGAASALALASNSGH